MANFRPLNNYMLYVLDRMIERYNLSPPFLDAGCGSGHVSAHLLSKGWNGKAIDFSEEAAKITKNNLKNFPKFKVERKNILAEKGKYKTILMFDVLEHIKDDVKILKKVYSLLDKEGYLIIGSPSNPREWRWDDDFYGHYRRYTKEELTTKLKKANLQPIIFWDYTFPVFWLMRRIYTRFKTPITKASAKEKRTKDSSFSNAWEVAFISKVLDSTTFLWQPLYKIQFSFFRNFTSWGGAMFILALKNKERK